MVKMTTPSYPQESIPSGSISNSDVKKDSDGIVIYTLNNSVSPGPGSPRYNTKNLEIVVIKKVSQKQPQLSQAIPLQPEPEKISPLEPAKEAPRQLEPEQIDVQESEEAVEEEEEQEEIDEQDL